MKPFQNWEDSDKYIHPMHVWGVQLDDRYLIEVQRKLVEISSCSGYRIDSNFANLCIFDHGEKDKLIHSSQTSLAYGAKFGPDANDVMRWQNESLEVINKLNG